MGERYHSFLRRIFIKVKTVTSNLSAKQALPLSIKAINDTAGPNGLIPTHLVFGVMPQIPIKSHNLPHQVAKVKAMKEARDEAVILVARTRLETETTSNVFAAANIDVKIGADVLVFKENPVAKWTKSFAVLNEDEKIFTLDSEDRTWVASIENIKRYLERGSESQKIDTSEYAAREEKDYCQHLHKIFGLVDDVLRDSKPISIRELVLKIIL